MTKDPVFLLLCVIIAGVFHVPDAGARQATCGLMECHGVNVTCGFDAPEACDMMYRMGDFCRQYSSCEVVEGECRTVTQMPFEQCRACVLECEKIKNDPAGAFDCENSCRQQLE